MGSDWIWWQRGPHAKVERGPQSSSICSPIDRDRWAKATREREGQEIDGEDRADTDRDSGQEDQGFAVSKVELKNMEVKRGRPWLVRTLLRFERPLGVLPYCRLGLQFLTGELDEFGFEDFLNDPQSAESFVPVDMHLGMELQLGLSKAPVAFTFL
ncbi:hypothetical protein L7F22_035598 [Adiantum nelumboides]|nr:hypothetical protein [Adiantum nelumboides]